MENVREINDKILKLDERKGALIQDQLNKLQDEMGEIFNSLKAVSGLIKKEIEKDPEAFMKATA